MILGDIPNRVKKDVSTESVSRSGRKFIVVMRYHDYGTYRFGMFDLQNTEYEKAVAELRDIIISEYFTDHRLVDATILDVVNSFEQPVLWWYKEHERLIESTRIEEQEKRERELYEKLKKKFG